MAETQRAVALRRALLALLLLLFALMLVGLLVVTPPPEPPPTLPLLPPCNSSIFCSGYAPLRATRVPSAVQPAIAWPCDGARSWDSMQHAYCPLLAAVAVVLVDDGNTSTTIPLARCIGAMRPLMQRVARDPLPHSDLLRAVQMEGVFNDSKDFVDMPLLQEPTVILEAFRTQLPPNPTRQQLADFVAQYFAPAGSDLLPWLPDDWQPQPPLLRRLTNATLARFAGWLNAQWHELGRRVDTAELLAHPQRHSLLPVRRPFIVPGGRFREFYYWVRRRRAGVPGAPSADTGARCRTRTGFCTVC